MYNVRKIRKTLGLSIEAFSKRVGAGVSTVVNWEQGHSSPRKDKLEKIHELFLEAQQRERELGGVSSADSQQSTTGSIVDKYLSLMPESQKSVEALIDHLLRLQNVIDERKEESPNGD